MSRIMLLATVAVAFLVTATAAAQTAATKPRSPEVLTASQLNGNIEAPDFPVNSVWLNSGRPFSLQDFRGKLVLLDFWTYCCINCMHVLPDLEKLQEKYPEELVIIGVHSAKFTNEKDTAQIRQAILRYNIRHPVIVDDGFRIWSDYQVKAWPTLVLINPRGNVIGVRSGEGVFDAFDPIITQAVDFFGKGNELKKTPLKLTLEATRTERKLLAFPGKVSVDATGTRLLITDTNHNRILITDPKGVIQTVIGSGKIGARDGTFAEAEFNHPQGVCVNGDTLFIADTENNMIRAAFLKTGEVKTLFGNGNRGQGVTPGATGTSIELNSPWDLLYFHNKLFIAMAGVHQIWVADPSTLGAAPFDGTGDEGRVDGPQNKAQLAQPSGVTTDGDQLFFDDSESSSIRVASSRVGGDVETIIGKGLFDYGDIDGDQQTARLQHPLGIAYKDGLLYIADTYNSKIKIVDPRKKTATTFAGTGKHGYVDGDVKTAQFNEPSGLAFIGDSLYVADANNHLIRVIDLKSKLVSTLELSNLQVLVSAPHDKLCRQGCQPGNPEKSKPEHDKISFVASVPDGFDNQQAGALLHQLAGNDSSVVKFGLRPQDASFDPSAGIEIPFEAASGNCEVILETVIYFCKEGSTICQVDNVRLHIPIEVSDRGPSMFGIAAKARVSPEM